MHHQWRAHIYKLRCLVQGFGVCLVMQLCLTNLHTLLERSARPLDAALAKAVMQQLLQALQAVHECGLVHRDVATTNVLFDGAGGVRLADFGLARQALPASDQGPGASGPVCMSPRVGTRWYVAPEVLFGSRHYGAAVDLWGAGCIMAELLTGQPLFPGSSDIQQACRMMRVLGSIDEEAWPGVKALPDWGKLIFPPHTAQPWESIAPGASPAALRLLQGLLQYNPEHRMGAAEALQAEYFTSEQPRAAGAAEVKAAVCALLAAPMSAGNQPADGNEPPAAMLL